MRRPESAKGWIRMNASAELPVVRRRWQFGLRTLLIATAGVAVFCGAHAGALWPRTADAQRSRNSRRGQLHYSRNLPYAAYAHRSDRPLANASLPARRTLSAIAMEREGQ